MGSAGAAVLAADASCGCACMLTAAVGCAAHDGGSNAAMTPSRETTVKLFSQFQAALGPPPCCRLKQRSREREAAHRAIDVTALPTMATASGTDFEAAARVSCKEQRMVLIERVVQVLQQQGGGPPGVCNPPPDPFHSSSAAPLNLSGVTLVHKEAPQYTCCYAHAHHAGGITWTLRPASPVHPPRLTRTPELRQNPNLSVTEASTLSCRTAAAVCLGDIVIRVHPHTQALPYPTEEAAAELASALEVEARVARRAVVDARVAGRTPPHPPYAHIYLMMHKPVPAMCSRKTMVPGSFNDRTIYDVLLPLGAWQLSADSIKVLVKHGPFPREEGQWGTRETWSKAIFPSAFTCSQTKTRGFHV